VGYNDVARPAEQLQVVANLRRFRNILTEFSKENPHGTVLDALKYIRELEESSVESVAPIGEELDAIRICTVHAAKGREWQHVIVVGCDSEGFPARWRGERDILPRALAEDTVPPKDAHYEEERRLFYVASTRAKDSLTYTWSQRSVANDNSNRQRNESPFLASIPENLLDERKQPLTQAILMRPPIVPEVLSNDKISVSFSALQDFRSCARRYQYRMEGKPKMRENSNVFGSLLHETLDQLSQQRQGGQHITGAIAETVWDKRWEATSENLPSEDGLDHRKVGREIVSEYIRSPYWQHANTQASEMKFEIKIADNLYFNGKFDRLDEVAGQPVLIDYKSGAPKDADELRDNRQQLLYYAVALREIYRQNGRELHEVRTEIHWINAKGITMTDKGLTFSAQQLDKAKETLTENLETIRRARLSGTFDVKPSAWNCTSCAFRLSCHEGRTLLDQESLHNKSLLYEQYGPKDQLPLFPKNEMQRLLKPQKETFSGLGEEVV
jgi:ATP-dependent exoDNAse (exonuclease V) beta subunit